MARRFFYLEDFGARGPIEFELNTEVREYRISWGKALADLTELAKLRWERKWTVARIANHQGISFHSAKMRLRRLKKKNGCYDRLPTIPGLPSDNVTSEQPLPAVIVNWNIAVI